MVVDVCSYKNKNKTPEKYSKKYNYYILQGMKRKKVVW